MRRALFAAIALTLLIPIYGLGQANGKLQIHFIDVGQGDGALLISPLGETVLFDNGTREDCDKPLSYLDQLGVSKIDYNVVSHYHDDHIGCTSQILAQYPVVKKAIDRGGSNTSKIFKRYLAAVGSKREKATKGMKITLDASSSQPVEITLVALNGNGIATKNENDRSLVAVVRYGNFDAVIGGDLSGVKAGAYDDIETSVAPLVGQVEVYKVHHHCSRYSTNTTWVSSTSPRVAVISVGDGNKHRHPTSQCLDRLETNGIVDYWTERGNGASPRAGHDIIGRNIVIEVAPRADVFTVTHSDGAVESYPMWGVEGSPSATTPKFAWSKASSVYHHSNCKYVDNISRANLERGDTAPEGKTLHKGCPK